jgi:hypothetical protein
MLPTDWVRRVLRSTLEQLRTQKAVFVPCPDCSRITRKNEADKLGIIDVDPALGPRCIRARPFGKLEKKPCN